MNQKLKKMQHQPTLAFFYTTLIHDQLKTTLHYWLQCTQKQRCLQNLMFKQKLILPKQTKKLFYFVEIKSVLPFCFKSKRFMKRNVEYNTEHSWDLNKSSINKGILTARKNFYGLVETIKNPMTKQKKHFFCYEKTNLGLANQ